MIINPFTMPECIEAEKSLLASLIRNPSYLDKIDNTLISDHFYSEENAKIFNKIKDMYYSDNIVDLSTLKDSFICDNYKKYIDDINTCFISFSSVPGYCLNIYDRFLRRELIEKCANISNDAQNISDNETIEEKIERAEKNIFKLGQSIDSQIISVHSIENVFNQTLDQIKKACNKQGSIIGLSTGLNSLDLMISGLCAPDVIILAGRPGMGKTALALNIALHVSQQNSNDVLNGVLVYTLEMSATQIGTRLISQLTKFPTQDLLRGQIDKNQFEEIEKNIKKLNNLNLIIDDTSSLNIDQIRSRTRRLVKQHNINFMVVDYLQLISPPKGKNTNRVEDVSYITRELKHIAKEFNIPVLVLSQLNRIVETRDNHKPRLSDLRDSGSIEQDADIVLFITRDEYYMDEKKPSETDKYKMNQWLEAKKKVAGKASLIVAKHRQGPIGEIQLRFDSGLTKFFDCKEK